MKKSAILLLVISMVGLVLGNIASFLAIGKLYANDFNILHVIEFNFTNINFISLVAIAAVAIICILIHFIFVCVRRKPIHLVFTFLILLGSAATAYTIPFTLVKTIDFLVDTSSASEANIVNAIACIGTGLCFVLALVSLGLSMLSMSEKKTEKVETLASTTSESININSNVESVVEETKVSEETKEETTPQVEVKEEPKVEEKVEVEEEVKEEIKAEETVEKKETTKVTPTPKKAPAKKKTVSKTKEETAKKVEESASKTTETKEEKKQSATKAYHVVKRKEDNKWTIKLANGDKVIKTFATKDEALEYAKGLASRQNGTLRVHASKGKSKGKIQKQ